MCKPIQVFRFSCGHALCQLPLFPVTLCVFADRRTCNELGTVRYIDYVRNFPCPQCGNWSPAQHHQHAKGRMNTPLGQGRPNVQALQRLIRPGQAISVARKDEIDRMVQRQLSAYLADPDFHQSDTLEWAVRLIASLPEFLAREKLVRILEPHLGAVFDERMQDELLPLFARIGVPDVYERTMRWTSHRCRRC